MVRTFKKVNKNTLSNKDISDAPRVGGCSDEYIGGKIKRETEINRPLL